MSKFKAPLSQVVCNLLMLSMAAVAAAKDSAEFDLRGYRRAREGFLENPGRPIPRAQWEAWVSNGDPQRINFLNSSRLRDLQSQHARLSYDNFMRAKKISKDSVRRGAPDLDVLRALPTGQRDKAIDRMCRRIPKGALLHVHPNGTIGADQALRILEDGKEPVAIKDIVFGKDRGLLELGFSPAELSAAEKLAAFDQKPIADWPAEAVRLLAQFMTLPAGPQSFARFDAVFPFVKLASKNVVMRLRTYVEHAKKVQEEGIQYIEYTTSIKINLETKTVASLADVDLLVQIADEVFKSTGVIVRYNISFLRTEPAKDLRTKAEVTLKFLKDYPAYQTYFVGIDLLGPEHKDSALDKGLPVYSVFLEEENRGGLKMKRTQHAGEHGDLNNPRDAMIMGAHRLGHATQLWYRKDRTYLMAESILAMEYARLNRVLIETNLSSNVRLNAVKTYWEQPWIILLRLGVPVALSTDNDGILSTTPSGECAIAVRESNLTYWELRQMAYDSVSYSFADTATKENLKKKLDNKFEQFESQQEWRR